MTDPRLRIYGKGLIDKRPCRGSTLDGLHGLLAPQESKCCHSEERRLTKRREDVEQVLMVKNVSSRLRNF